MMIEYHELPPAQVLNCLLPGEECFILVSILLIFQIATYLLGRQAASPDAPFKLTRQGVLTPQN